jgi:putative addiction module component (TIGR02574 family)
MTTKARQVLREALSLPPKARADIAGTLLRSLDVEDDPDIEAAWAIEIERRLKDVESGKVKLVPWETVRRRLRATLKRGRSKV